MSWAAQASLKLPASSLGADASERDAEDAAVAERCGQLRSRLGKVSEEDLGYVLDAFTSQIRETWGLRRALAAERQQQGGMAAAAMGPRRSNFQTQIFEAEARSAQKQELLETELCSELVREAKGLAEHVEILRARDRTRDAKHAHWEEAALRLPGVLKAEGALRQRAEAVTSEEMHLQESVEEWQCQSAAEILACRFEVNDLQKQCGELRGELVQAQAVMSISSSEVQAAAEVVGPEPSELRDWQYSRTAAAAVRWHDAGSVFDAFASPVPERSPRMMPADFGHLCERLRRAQGRRPKPDKDRRDFADFAFAAVFGSAADVDRGTFARLFPHFALMLHELEEAFEQSGE
ncbi:GLN1 [Symbiodinium microadriaticum]|nr:GLN1 [Symbiodinium microadriaticum]